MRRKETIYLTEELAAFLEKVAKEEGMTFSSCCSRIIQETAAQMQENRFLTCDEANDNMDATVHVELHGKAGAILKKKASELGLTPTEWVRGTVMKKNLTLYSIELDDLGEMLTTMDRLVAEIEGICGAMLENKKLYKQDLELIRERMEVIINLFRLHFSSTIYRRKKEQKRLEKKYSE